mgnify:CR=1 FL=1
MIHPNKSISLIIIILFLFLTLLIAILTQIDIRETLKTNYHNHNNAHIIDTKHFNIITPKSWIHISNGYGEEGEAIGSFLTPKGRLIYEYGMFANPFDVDSVFVYSLDSLKAGDYVIRIARNNKNETGITFFDKNTMEWPFSFFMSNSCTKNLSQLISGIECMTFKDSKPIN